MCILICVYFVYLYVYVHIYVYIYMCMYTYVYITYADADKTHSGGSTAKTSRAQPQRLAAKKEGGGFIQSNRYESGGRWVARPREGYLPNLEAVF
jgi:hypothetical protein